MPRLGAFVGSKQEGLVAPARGDDVAAAGRDQMVRAGQGERRLPLCVRCRDCGEQGRVQVRPPAPTRSTSGWIAPVNPTP